MQDTRYYDSQGKPVQGIEGSGVARGRGGDSGRIEDVTDEEQKDNDRLYEERMEDEYAKREGGA